MKVLLVSAIAPPAGGIATWTEQYRNCFRATRNSLTIVNTALIGKRKVQINDNRNIYDEIVRTMKIIKDMSTKLKITGPDVVHINSSCSKLGIIRDYVCVLRAYLCNVPVIFHCHCNIEDQIKGRYALHIFKKVTKMSSRILVLNSKSYEFVRKITNCKVQIIPNFIAKEMLAEKVSIKQEIEEIIYVGHVQASKGCKEIYEAAQKFPNIRYTLIGPVSKEIREMECPENVALLGAQEHSKIKEYLTKADLFLFPSYTEGFSLSLVEAMAAGLPVIASNVGANKDMIEDKGGVIIPVKDSEAIEEAIKKMRNSEIRKQYAEWNLKKVKGNYIDESVLSRLFSIYREVLK